MIWNGDCVLCAKREAITKDSRGRWLCRRCLKMDSQRFPGRDEPDHLVAPMGGFLHGVLERIKNGTLKPAPRGSIRFYTPLPKDPTDG